jgi:hypothetical protein
MGHDVSLLVRQVNAIYKLGFHDRPPPSQVRNSAARRMYAPSIFLPSLPDGPLAVVRATPGA